MRRRVVPRWVSEKTAVCPVIARRRPHHSGRTFVTARNRKVEAIDGNVVAELLERYSNNLDVGTRFASISRTASEFNSAACFSCEW